LAVNHGEQSMLNPAQYHWFLGSKCPFQISTTTAPKQAVTAYIVSSCLWSGGMCRL